jgi:hypothetical protein
VTVKALLARIVVVVLCCVGLATMNPVSAEAASAIQITKVYYNSPGSDYGSNTSLNAEWVRITNTGTTYRTLTGWTLRDASAHVYTFPTFKIAPGARGSTCTPARAPTPRLTSIGAVAGTCGTTPGTRRRCAELTGSGSIPARRPRAVLATSTASAS